MLLGPFLPALVFGLIAIGLLVAAASYGPKRVGRVANALSTDPVLFGYAAIAAVLCAIFIVLGIGIAELNFVGLDPE